MTPGRTKARVTFTDFDTTSEVSGLDGSTYIVVTVHFAIDHGTTHRAATASVGISTRQSRSTYEVVEPAWWANEPELSRAILDYVREAERVFRAAAAGHDHRRFERTMELELDPSAVP